MVDTNNQQIEYELWVPLCGTKLGWGVFAYPTAAPFGACSGFLMDTCPLGTRR